MKIAVAQINSIIGDINGNKEKIISYYKKAQAQKADLVIFPELTLCGYPPLDLIERKEFLEELERASLEIAKSTDNKTAIVFGSIIQNNNEIGAIAYNCAIMCYSGEIKFVQRKSLIPYYDVFDEIRYFEPANEVYIHEFKGEKVGITICEDIWNDPQYWSKRRYSIEPVNELVKQGATLLLNISASPYSYGKRALRYEMLTSLVSRIKIPLVYCCYVGAQTELIFDGASMCFDSDGILRKIGEKYSEDFFVYDTNEKINEITEIESSFEEEVHDALILGIKDYAEKLGFKKALIALSGGIDSAIVVYFAVKAFGNENVSVVMLPSQYSSGGSVDDSVKLINKLNIKSDLISIQPIFDSVLTQLKPLFEGTKPNIAEENMQSRARGLCMMAISNKFGDLLLTTGNKSEVATGYATLYGDMCGALGVIGDVYKTDIYRLCKYINRNEEIIPQEIIDKAPSAELRPDQKDQDTLPEYPVLDKILKMYIEENKDLDEISEVMKDRTLVKYVLDMVDKNEFKRKQAAPILRVTSKAFGTGRRYPIVQGWRKNMK